ncbi:MAG TPA: transporter substrate-binding domain-containing protein [Paucimonas sp.]|nr:transporter substrate-binding domain-containing protein [Paucimonas sp.]
MRYRQAMLLSVFLSVAATAHALQLVTEDDPPHNMLKDGKVVGVATEKIEEAFRRVKLVPRIELMPWARAYQSALSQRDYCVFSAARTAERERLFKWIGPIAAMDWVLYARADNAAARPAKLEDLRKETIGGYVQDVISVWLADHRYNVETATSDSINPKKLMAGRFDYWASSRPRATALLAKENLAAHIVPVLTFGHTDLYLACHPSLDDELARRLNNALRRMKEDGTAARIEARYARWPAE